MQRNLPTNNLIFRPPPVLLPKLRRLDLTLFPEQAVILTRNPDHEHYWYRGLYGRGKRRRITAKRLFDPAAVSCGITGLMVYILSEPGMIEQRRKIPFPVNMWLAWPMVKRMLRLGVLTFIAAIGVVSTR